MIYSTNDIWRGNEENHCLEDDLIAMEGDIQDLKDSQGGSYTHPESHPASMITGLAPVATTGAYADLTGKPTIPAAYTHPDAHPMSMINGLEAALAAKAPNSALSGKADLVDGKVPSAQLPGFVDDVLEYANQAAFPATGESGKIYVAQDTNKTYRWSGSDYVVISDTIALGETYATAYRGDRGKIAYDHSQNGTVHVTADQKTAWDSKAAGNHGHSYNDLTDKPTIPTIPSSLPANGGDADTVDGKHASDFATADHNHSGFAASSHTHALSAITGLLDLLATDAAGNVSSSASTSDVLAHIKALPSGMHTVYAQASAPNAPNSKEGWRFLVHKTGSADYGWVIAFGTNGSIYTTYLNNGTWRSWKALYEAAPDPLWSGGANGGYYMTAGHTVTPSKKLSECRNGWLLLWSDYDVGGQANNTDFCTTIIPKRAYTGQVWNGAMWYCDVPSYAAGTATDSEIRVVKVLQIYDNKIIGTENNAAAPRNDVVLRAVYEF